MGRRHTALGKGHTENEKRPGNPMLAEQRERHAVVLGQSVVKREREKFAGLAARRNGVELLYADGFMGAEERARGEKD